MFEKKSYKKLQISLLIVFICLVLFAIISNKFNVNHRYQKRIDIHFSGIVQNKYNAKGYLLKVTDNRKETYYQLSVGKKEYDIIDIGDSVVKLQGDSDCILINYDTTFKIRYTRNPR